MSILYVMIHRWILEFESCHKLHLADASCELARKQAGHAFERLQLSGIQCKVSTKSIPTVPSLPEKHPTFSWGYCVIFPH